jgi:uncharacterized repeat protein (TIGR01451 family)
VSAGGTVTYRLFPNDTCEGTPVYQQTYPVTNGSVPASALTTVTTGGLYNWVVSYSGDRYNAPAESGCGIERFFVGESDIDLTTQVELEDGTDVPDDGSVPVDSEVRDTTTLTGATETAGGTVLYQLYANADCSGEPVASEQVTVTNGDVPPSNLQTLSAVSSYNWVVTYSGDAENPPAASACGNETVVTTAATPVITTLLSAEVVSVGDEVNDTATLTGATADAGGTVNYVVFSNEDCSGEPVYTLGPVTVANGVVPDSPAQMFDTAGDYQWQARYSGDAKNAAATSECGTEPLSVLAPSLSITKTADADADGTIYPGDTVGFTITVTNAGPGIARDVDLTDTLPVAGGISWTLDTATSSEDCAITSGELACEPRDLEPNGTIIAHVTSPTTVESCGTMTNQASYSSTNGGEGDSPEVSIEIVCREIVLTTLVELEDGTDVPDDSSVQVDSVVRDTATMEVTTETAGGTVTYYLYANADCSGEPLATEEVTVTNGEIPPSSLVTLDTVGTYNWVVEYSGDIVNLPATSACGSETVVTTAATPTITTLLSSEEVSEGDEVNDTAVLSGATTDASGTVTYVVFDNADCSGEPVYSLGPVEVVDGIVPDSPSQVFDTAGDYQWQAIYSGDAKNAPATSECGTEPLSVLAPALSIVKTADADADGTVYAGETIGFTITVSNAGPGVARGVTLTDALPESEGLAWSLNAANSSADCAITDGDLACAARDLEPNSTIVAHVTSPTTVGSCGTIENQAEFGSDNGGDAVSEPVTITIECMIEVPVYKLLCADSPGEVTIDQVTGDALPEGCERGPGIAFDVSENGGAPVAYTTDDAGMFTAEATIGSSVVISETGVPEDYAPLENPQTIANLQPGEDGVVFVNVLQTGSADLLKFICPSDTAEAPFFEISTQRPDEGRPTAGCISGSGVSFTITGDRLAEPVTIVTDENGLAHLDLPVGDYTILEDATGGSAPFTVEPNLTVAIRVFNADPTFAGSVTVSKFWCELEDNATTITVDGTVPEGCAPGDAELSIDGEPVFHVGEDGAIEFAIAPGTHTITEACADATASFDVPAGAAVDLVVLNDPDHPVCGQGDPGAGPGTPGDDDGDDDGSDGTDDGDGSGNSDGDDEPIESLPNTGTGADQFAPGTYTATLMIAIAAMVGAVVGLGGIRQARRRTKH